MTHLGNHLRRINPLLVSTSFSLITLLLSGAIVRAQDSNFGTFTLNGKTLSSVVTGATGGSTSLPAVTANTDRNDNQCLGFGDPKPDHIMQLTRKIDRLKLQVDSGGKDTTLVIMGPDGDLRCADDYASSKDAGLDDEDWKPGLYKVWVGSITPGARRDYRLIVQGF